MQFVHLFRRGEGGVIYTGAVPEFDCLQIMFNQNLYDNSFWSNEFLSRCAPAHTHTLKCPNPAPWIEVKIENRN
jgi:hypothetical protein